MRILLMALGDMSHRLLRGLALLDQGSKLVEVVDLAGRAAVGRLRLPEATGLLKRDDGPARRVEGFARLLDLVGHEVFLLYYRALPRVRST
jgi:hypothetical protein